MIKNLFSYKKLHIDTLELIKEHNERNKNSDNKAHYLNLISTLNVKGYSENESNESLISLVDVGYLEVNRRNYFLTEKGRLFLEDYKLRKIEPLFTRSCKFIRKNFAEVFSVIAIIISIIGLFVK